MGMICRLNTEIGDPKLRLEASVADSAKSKELTSPFRQLGPLVEDSIVLGSPLGIQLFSLAYSRSNLPDLLPPAVNVAISNVPGPKVALYANGAELLHSYPVSIVTHGTGMVGGYALRYALEHPAVGRVTTIGRKRVGISHPKLKEVLHQDFADCWALAQVLTDQQAAIFCLGAYTGAVPDTELRTITVDYTIEFARVLHGSSPDAVFAFLRGTGADPAGRSRMS